MERRNEIVEKHNLIQICRFSTKTMLDKASVGTIEESSPDTINLLGCLECILNHGMKRGRSPIFSADLKSFWPIILEHMGTTDPTIVNVNLAGAGLPPLLKARLWLRVVLMEKKLSDHLRTLKNNTKIMSKYYTDRAILQCDEMNLLIEDFVGLNSIDFSFCLRNKDAVIGRILIDYTPYLTFSHCREGIDNDMDEKRDPTKTYTLDIPPSADDSARISTLQKAFRITNEQKSYLEEMLNKAERENSDFKHQVDKIGEEKSVLQQKHDTEIKSFEDIVLELQKEIQTLKNQNKDLQRSIQTVYYRKSNTTRAASNGSLAKDDDHSDVSDELCLIEDTMSTRPLHGSINSGQSYILPPSRGSVASEPSIFAAGLTTPESKSNPSLHSSNHGSATPDSLRSDQLSLSDSMTKSK